MNMVHEVCCNCNEHTGRAGAFEDSIYFEEFGPYCEGCRDDIGEIFAARITALEQENAKLLAAMRAIWPYLQWTISAESLGYHPTMPSAVAAFKEVMGATNHEIRLAAAMEKSK
jgi:hypothetical protein